MERLLKKYSPRTFAAVVGQDSARSVLSAYVERGGGEAFLLKGPFGAGKTSLALVTTAALLCEVTSESRQGPEPCGECGACRAVWATVATGPLVSPLFTYQDCGVDHSIASVRRTVEDARTSPSVFGPRRVVVLDEAHDLDDAGYEALLGVLNAPPHWLTAFLLTTAPDRLPETVYSRCIPLDVELLSDAKAHAYAVHVCQEEGIPYEDEAIALVVAKAQGHVRDLIKYLDLVARPGAVDLANAKLWTKLGHTQPLVDYLKALADRRPLSEQLQILKRWSTEPELKVEALQRLLTFLLMNDVLRQHFPDRTLVDLSQADRSMIVAAFNARADADGRPRRVFWQELISFWTRPPGTVNEGGLIERLMWFDGRVNPTAIRDALPGRLPRRASGGAPPAARRVRTLPTIETGDVAQPGEGPVYLTSPQVRRFWDAGSFMAREHGCWFNARATFMHARLGSTDHKGGAEFVGKFVHELRMALARWGPGNEDRPGADEAFHWICLHESDPRVGHVSHVVAHVPVAFTRDVRLWFGGNFLPNKRGPGRGSVRLKLATVTGASRDVWLHAHLLRTLSRGLDPSVLTRDLDGWRRPLIDVLGVRSCLQRPAGPIDLGKRFTTSESIGLDAQRRERAQGFTHLSAFAARAWARLDDGWEMTERADRVRWRQEAEQRRAMFAVASSSVTLDGESTGADFRFDASRMLRSWEMFEKSTKSVT